MRSEYAEWITSHYPTPDSAAYACADATEAMVSEFPELTRTRGHVRFATGYRRPHWWVTAPTGEVIDPTAHQWEDPVVEYEPLPPDFVNPIGRCLNCGGLCFRAEGATAHHCGPCVSRGDFGF